MAEAQLHVVEVPGSIQLSQEHVCLSAGAFTALQLTIPDDFRRPGARRQLLLSDRDSHAIVTVAAVLPDGDPAEAAIGMGDPDRLFAGAAPSATVSATTDVLAAGQLVETVTESGDVAVIAPHGSAIERHTGRTGGHARGRSAPGNRPVGVRRTWCRSVPATAHHQRRHQ